MRRDTEHYRAMMRGNPAAQIGFRLAARAIYAARHGACEDIDCASDEWSEIARDLKTNLGESCSAGVVLDLMEPA
jgi:hypothetical protein